MVCGLLTLGGTRHTCPCYTTAATRVVVVSSEVQASWLMVQTPQPTVALALLQMQVHVQADDAAPA